MRERILFVTGKLAEFSLRRVLDPLSRQAGFDYEVAVLRISVAALMHADWLLDRLNVPSGCDRVVLPGWCQGELQPLRDRFGVPVELGPKDLHDLPESFGSEGRQPVDLSRYDVEILAEINHAPKLSDAQIVDLADRYRQSGADVIDLGMVPGQRWQRAGDVTELLRKNGHRVSIDSFDRFEVEAAVEHGAELVLSCNSGNVEWAGRLDAELVAIPDDPRQLDTLEPVVSRLQELGARLRIDPILEPIGFGFAESLWRFFEARRRWPDLAMMMGVGNLTELTEVDTAGVNMLLAGICQELRIGSVLTTEVIPWARTAVREFDLARRIARYSIEHRVLPKHLDSGLLVLRDAKVVERGHEELDRLASQLTDPNFRIFVECGEIHLMNRDGHWRGRDPYELIDAVIQSSGPLETTHAFYLGFELSKAVTAMTLGKQYTQDAALDWGFLTVEETSAVERRRNQKPQGRGETGETG